MSRLKLIGLAAVLTLITHFGFSQPASSENQSFKFRNNYADFEPKGLVDFLTWRWNAWRDGYPRPASRPTPRIDADLNLIHTNALASDQMQPTVTWIGHATALIQFAGLNILTDPIFSERASPLSLIGPKRVQPPGIMLSDLPRIDFVLISHNHYDHLDESSVRALASQPGRSPIFVVPAGLASWFKKNGIASVVELSWWQSYSAASPTGPVEIMLVPVQHWSGRTLTDRMETLWGGFAVFAADFQFLHLGDTGYSPDFREIARRFADRQRAGGFDLVLIPIGAYAPRWFMKDHHVDPAEAVQIHQDLKATRSLAYHWGTFSLSDEALDEPPIELAAARLAAGVSESEFAVIAIGQTLTLPARQQRQ